ncbi:MAG: hypothetical protein B7Z73_07035 [Planctomycetia bacterium 21-64-5]|nr:MAG: hypothetical protein B7Z73_07035 [Planctomycetia bacterium 21-64-5]
MSHYGKHFADLPFRRQRLKAVDGFAGMVDRHTGQRLDLFDGRQLGGLGKRCDPVEPLGGRKNGQIEIELVIGRRRLKQSIYTYAVDRHAAVLRIAEHLDVHSALAVSRQLDADVGGREQRLRCNHHRSRIRPSRFGFRIFDRDQPIGRQGGLLGRFPGVGRRRWWCGWFRILFRRFGGRDDRWIDRFGLFPLAAAVLSKLLVGRLRLDRFGPWLGVTAFASQKETEDNQQGHGQADQRSAPLPICRRTFARNGHRNPRSRGRSQLQHFQLRPFRSDLHHGADP